MRHTKNAYMNALVKWCLKKQPKMPIERRRVRAARMAFTVYSVYRQNSVKLVSAGLVPDLRQSPSEIMEKLVPQLDKIRLGVVGSIADSRFIVDSKTAIEPTNDASVGIETNPGE